MIGQTISHYKILEKLGEGGMGVVYKAQDTTLDRFVALKFLPHHLSSSEQDKARFIQEAKAASAINHPNICTIHDIQEHDGSIFIVMEFVDGQTLKDLPSPCPMKRAIDIGIQIADGLAAAHEKGIVHRDIKPDNIMIRKDGIAQIMDFGLAKLRTAKSVSRLTREGSTVGTAGYMSPEQVQGLDADHRSDIFSLGILLYELFAGQLPFKGVHETALMYEIVNVDPPPPSAFKPEIGPELDRIVLECMEKDSNERTQSVKQIAIDLKRARRESGRERASRITAAMPVSRSSGPSRSGVGDMSGPVASIGKRSSWWIVTAVVAIVAALGGFGVSYFLRPMADPTPEVRASIELPSNITYVEALGGHTAISPDGSMIVFAAEDSLSQTRLWLRHLNMTELTALAGTEDATYPFWSPDNKAVGFFADGKVKTVSTTGGPVLTLADAPFGRGGTWGKNGDIVFLPSINDLNLATIPASGGATRPVTAFDSTNNIRPRFPFFLPDGNHFVFSMLSLDRNTNATDAYLGSLEKPEAKQILQGASHAQYASGHLFFIRQGILMAQPYDPESFSLSGNPVPLQGNINFWPARAKADFSVSEGGVLVYSHGMTGSEAEFVWTNSDGVEIPILRTSIFTVPGLSPDGTRIAFDAIDQAVTSSVWVYDITSKAKLRLTFAQRSSGRPVWSADQSTIYYNVEVDGNKANIFFKRADGSGEEVLLASGAASASVGYYASDVSPDGRFLLLSVSNESQSDLAMIDLHGTQRPLPVTALGIRGRNGRFSHDGRWIVYQSNESGSPRIYVASFGSTSSKWQISSDGASGPYWRKDKIIYYSASNNRYEVVSVASSSGTPTFSQPEPLFPKGSLQQNTIIDGISPDGTKYLGVRQIKGTSAGHLALVINWKGMLEKK